MLWTTIVLVGIACAAGTELLRRLPPFEAWTLEGRKPFACHTCMSYWTAIIAHALLIGLGTLPTPIDAATIGAAALGVCASAAVSLLYLYTTDYLAGNRDIDLP